MKKLLLALFLLTPAFGQLLTSSPPLVWNGYNLSLEYPLATRYLSPQLVQVGAANAIGNLILSSIAAPTSTDVPTVAAGAAGVLTGIYRYKVSFGNANIGLFNNLSSINGESEVGAVSGSVPVSSQQINLTNIPIGPPGTTYRNIYRTTAGGPFGVGQTQLTGTIANNISTVFTDNKADANLGVFESQLNTTGAAFFLNNLNYTMFGNASITSTAFGQNAGFTRTGTVSAFGINTFHQNRAGLGGVAVGNAAAYYNRDGNGTTAVGDFACVTQTIANANTDGDSNTCLGQNAGSGDATQHDHMSVIGADATCVFDSAICLGRSTDTVYAPGLAAASGDCLQIGTGGSFTSTGLPCGGATIPSVTNLISGDGAGNGADSGIVPANVVQLTSTQTLTNKVLTSGTNTFPTFNQSTTGTAAALTATPTLCTAPQIPTGVLANGNATGCHAPNGTAVFTGTTPAFTASVTSFSNFIGYVSSINSSRNGRQTAAPMSCTAANFMVTLASAASGTGAIVLTLEKNGVATALTVNVPASTAMSAVVSDTTHTVSIAAGDLLDIQGVNAATAVSPVFYASITCSY